MRITAPAFATGTPIPTEHTQEGRDDSPALIFEDVPNATRSFVLICEDPDAPDPAAPQRVWLHWLIANLPGESRGLEAGIRNWPEGTLIGCNDGGVTGWSGPRPPIGTHRYYFDLYALDSTLTLPKDFTREQVRECMQPHILAHAQTMGTYLLKANRGP